LFKSSGNDSEALRNKLSEIQKRKRS
jgi:hypothetical protein